MSDTAIERRALLADPGQAGAYFIDEHDGATLADAAQALDFALIRIDFEGCSDKADALARFAHALQFPQWFGGNWDALADCLSDLSWLPADGYVLLLDNIDAWRAASPEDFDTALDILNEAALGWSRIHRPFWSLVPVSTEILANMQD